MFNRRTHPGEENLLRFCEGELRAAETARVARHLDACWDCRTHVDDLRKTIGEYVHYRKDTLQPSLPNPPQQWPDLTREFQRIRAEQSKKAGPGAVFRRPLSWMLFSGAVLLASTAVFLSRPDHNTRKQLDDSLPATITPRLSSPSPITESAPESAPDSATARPPASHAASEPPPVTADDELNTIASLHRIGADLGDPIEVVRKQNAIVVSAAGLDTARADQLRAALSGLPQVSLQFSTGSPSLPPASSHAPLVESGQKSPLDPQISRLFNDRVEFQKLVDTTLQSSEAMMDRAHALKMLADRFPPAVAAQMSPRSAALLTSIRREHVLAMANHVAAINRSMAPVLRSTSGMARLSQEPAAPANWQELTYQLFSSAQMVDRLVGMLLAPTAGSATSDSAPSDLAAALGNLSIEVTSYERRSAGDQAKGSQ
jgi:anti-sigma factor RsiW